MYKNPNRIKIAIQANGRLKESSIDFLSGLGINIQKNSRNLIYSSTNSPVDIFFIRDDDIPLFVNKNVVDFGICGKDIAIESNLKLKYIGNLGFAKCNLVIATLIDSQIKSIFDLSNKKIATSYPNILEQYLKRNSIKANIIKINGSVEIMPRLNLADAILDITQTGKTIKENGLQILTNVMSSEAVLIENFNYKQSKNQFFNLLDKSIRLTKLS